MLFALLVLQFRLPITEFTLENGLKVIVYEDHSTPVVSAQIWYRTGSYNDPLGKSGLSHFLEHMSFKGTERYGPKDYDRIIQENGGEENAFTSHHYIAYFANLSKDRYELELDLEADRMVNLRLDSSEMERERMVVLEELRLGENDPFELLWTQVRAIGFNHSPYQNPIIGWEKDVEGINRRDMVSYYQRYFNPANAVLVIAGDVDPVKAKETAERYFGRIKGRKVTQDSIIEPKPIGERRVEIERGLKNPIIMLGYHTPSVRNPDYYPLEIAFSILGRGPLSRLYKNLVYEKRLATRVGVYYDDNRYPGLSNFYAYVAPGVSIDSIKKEIIKTIETIKDSVDPDEMERVKNGIISEFYYNQDGVYRMGIIIGWAEVVAGGYRFIEEFPARIGKVTIDRVKDVARKYLSQKKFVLGVIR